MWLLFLLRSPKIFGELLNSWRLWLQFPLQSLQEDHGSASPWNTFAILHGVCNIRNITCATNVAWRTGYVSCSESGLILAGEVGRKVRADRDAGPQLEIEPGGAAGLVANVGVHPRTKDERSCKEMILSLEIPMIAHQCTGG